MLNIFPIQFLAPLAYMILRVGIGILLIRLGITHARYKSTPSEAHDSLSSPRRPLLIWSISILEIGIGFLFVVGLFTQVAALILILLSFLCIFTKRYCVFLPSPGRMFYILLCVSSISLFITGAGAFAFDLPI